jgi:Tfp pilus assembly protein FimT
MSRITKNKKRLGFSLLELVTVMVIITATVAMSVPLFARSARRDDLRKASRGLAADLARSRSLAASGYRTNVSPPWLPGDRTMNAGIVINGPSSYSVFIDKDATSNGNEITVAVVTLPNFVTIAAPPAGTEIRFRPNGTVVNVSNVVVTDNQIGLSRTVVLTGGGALRVQ